MRHKNTAQLILYRLGLRRTVKTISVVFHVVVAVMSSIILASCEQFSTTPTPTPQPLSADRLETVRLSNQSLRGVNLSGADMI